MLRVETLLRNRLALVCSGLLVQPSLAFAQDSQPASSVQECATAYEQAQISRNAGNLSESQRHLLICVQENCPEFIRTDCGRWLSDVKREVPSVIFSAVDSDEQELRDVTVAVDGKAVASGLDGSVYELDPGQHEFVFNYQGRTVTLKESIRQGEKNRVLTVKIQTLEDSDGDGILDRDDRCPQEAGVQAYGGCAPTAQLSASPATRESGIPPLRWVAFGAGGAGLVALGLGAGFGIPAYQDAGAYEKKCGGENNETCPEAETTKTEQDIKSKYKVANILFAAGGVLAATGGTLFWLSLQDDDATPSASTSVGVTPVLGGGFVSVRSGF